MITIEQRTYVALPRHINSALAFAASGTPSAEPMMSLESCIGLMATSDLDSGCSHDFGEIRENNGQAGPRICRTCAAEYLIELVPGTEGRHAYVDRV